jgi:molybdopterin synthase sulfur carrier subunit
VHPHQDAQIRQVTLRYFAWVREKIGLGEERVALPDGVATAAELIGWLRARGEQYDEAFRKPEVIRIAIDRVHSKPSASIANAREIGFFPPMTGG